MAGPGATQHEQEQQQQLQQRLYQEVNALRGQARELQLKHDNQSVLLKHTEEELRELKIKYRKLRAGQQGDGGAALGHASPEAALESVRKQLEAKEQELQKTHALLDKTLYENGTLEANIEDIRDREAQNLAEIERLNMRLESLQDALNSVKTVAYQFEEENQSLTEELRDLRVVEAELRESIANKDDILGSLQSEAQMIGKQKSDMNAARRERNRNTRQVLLLAENSNRMQGEMHASLLAHQRLLEELKTEYEEHAELVRAEWNLDRKSKIEDYDRLSEQLENLKIIQLEDKEQLLQEQGEVVRALQTQFEEYRQTAEYLFTTEAAKLEDKVRIQAAKYEEEIKYMVKAKDQHFDTMMSAKDAKILNLIEGTDLQSILIKHEQEIEQLRRSHADDLAAMRQRTEAEQRDTIAALRKQIDASAVVHAKLEGRLAKADERVREALDLNRKRLEQQAQREEKHMEDLQAIQNLLEEAHRAKEKLNQDKQDLRHRIVRLKIKVKGDGDETLPNLVKRLSLETSSLKAKYNKMLGHHELVVKKHRQLEQKTLVQKQQIDRVREAKQAKERELTELAHNFSRVLFSRVRAAMGIDAATTSPSKYAGRKADRGANDDQEGRDLTLRRALATLQEVLDGDSSVPSAEKPTFEEDQAQGVDKANAALSNEDDDSLESARGGGAKVRFQVPSALRRMRQ
ncbi:Hypothetical Protein FCC1311_050272 [Hondaea fermentalgiana]|uniref:Uncharacterized protein n=1 Tax=Hondaea fermentalgiana TaxID=2315210 RepID=A0A2R5GCW1_9STRA|nr:Hypothetical Protein FCC1311_050272 [Hondaea fermentalgiana]|eukprot:GBG28806.1 Hypothetical Protein FCC1311_050272 [Hondaea fermentalgiana]